MNHKLSICLADKFEKIFKYENIYKIKKKRKLSGFCLSLIGVWGGGVKPGGDDSD